MKNIHVLPTDNPSRLQLQMNGNYHIENGETIALKSFQNIYITSDSKFVRDEYITDGIEVIKATPKLVNAQGLVDRRDWKKIILTTDQDLIANGVQAIDDEFLEWFVKNPSCEEVEIYEVGGKLFAEPIIPQEEPKQETLTYTEASKKEERIFNSTMMKQETLEEAAEKYARAMWGVYYDDVHPEPAITLTLGELSVKDFSGGAKWQAERMYSEEDLREAFRQGQDNMDYSDTYGWDSKLTEQEWFEQFKK